MRTRGRPVTGHPERKKRRHSVAVSKCSAPSTHVDVVKVYDDFKENVPPDEGNLQKKRKTNKKQKGKGLSLDSGRAELLKNNRELATALEEAQVKIGKHSMANVELKRQLYHERQLYVERVNNEINRRMQDQWTKVYEVIQKATTKLMEATKLFEGIHGLFSSACTPTNTPTPLHTLHTSSLRITPPEDEDMRTNDVTALDVVPMETTTVSPGIIDLHVALADQLGSVPGLTDQNMSEEYNLIGINMNKTVSFVDDDEVTMATELSFMDTDNHNESPRTLLPRDDMGTRTTLTSDDMGSRTSPSLRWAKLDSTILTTPILQESCRARRRTPNVSYTMPSLRSKLRRGDPFTDSTLDQALPQTQKRKGKLSTSSVRKRQRSALSNISNIISEED